MNRHIGSDSPRTFIGKTKHESLRELLGRNVHDQKLLHLSKFYDTNRRAPARFVLLPKQLQKQLVPTSDWLENICPVRKWQFRNLLNWLSPNIFVRFVISDFARKYPESAQAAPRFLRKIEEKVRKAHLVVNLQDLVLKLGDLLKYLL